MGRGLTGFLLLSLLLAGSLAPLVQAAPSALERRLVSFDADVPPDGVMLGGARILEAFPFASVALVEGAPSDLARLAAMRGVSGVYREEPLTFLMARERDIVQAEPKPGEPWPSGANVTIALVDSGLDRGHPAFAGRVAEDLRISRSGSTSPGGGDEDGHGTHVAGILAGDGAMSADGRQHGIAPAARIVSIDISEAFTTTSAVRAFAWIHEHRHEHDIRVVSNSWGREKEDAHYDPDDPVIRASDALVADGLVVVFSAGNRGREGSATLTTEATNPNVITVGAASAAGRAEPYSSRGPAVDGNERRLDWVKPDVTAPGTAIISTRAHPLSFQHARNDEEQYYVTMNGTSMAAPQVAAAAALLLDAHPSLTPSMVAAILTGTARDIGAPGADPDTGHGMISVSAALDAARLIAGGERHVVTERRVPVHAAGTVTAAPETVVLTQGAPHVPPADKVVVPMLLPEHAVEIDLWFNWTGPGDFEVALVGPGGATSFERVTGSSLRLVRPASPGEHRLEARPIGVSVQAAYEVSGTVLVREERDVEVPAELHARATYASGGFFVPQTTTGRMMGVLAAAPGLVLALAGAITATAAVVWRARRAKR